ncbi:hypothetical protein AT5A_08965 [Agrobacterium tumefaciens 5A]|nr:hypothetical protein AT5A_08965 [Agrobacterium tumefaciens 5A]
MIGRKTPEQRLLKLVTKLAYQCHQMMMVSDGSEGGIQSDSRLGDHYHEITLTLSSD